MPTPNQNESPEDFVSRCIPIVLNEGTARNVGQAYAICVSFYERGIKDEKIIQHDSGKCDNT